MAARANRPIAGIFGFMLKAVILCVLIAAVVVGCANLITVGTTRGNVHRVADLAEADADAVLVLGASVRPDGTPSDMLRDRLDTAISVYNAGGADAIICSGDNRTTHYNESSAMKAYCVAQGVPSEDVFEDHEGFSTYESMYRARHVFGVDRIIVSTQAYHLYRAMYIARGLGMEAYGVASDKGSYENQRGYSLREIGARTKDFFNTLVKTPVPSADGQRVDLSSSGDLT